MVRTVLFNPTLGFSLNLLILDFHSWGVPVYYSYHARKATKLPILNKMFRMVPPKLSIWFRMDLPKWVIWFCIILPKVHIEFHSAVV